MCPLFLLPVAQAVWNQGSFEAPQPGRHSVIRFLIHEIMISHPLRWQQVVQFVGGAHHGLENLPNEFLPTVVQSAKLMSSPWLLCVKRQGRLL